MSLSFRKISLEGFLKKNHDDVFEFCKNIYEHSYAVLEICSLDLLENLKKVNEENKKFFLNLDYQNKMQTQGNVSIFI